MAGHPSCFYKLAAVIFTLSCFLHGSHQHFYLSCVDYRDPKGVIYSESKCKACPRSGHYYTKDNFDTDTGYLHIPSELKPCRTRRDDHCSYNTDCPMAVYRLNQKVTLARSTNNHHYDSKCPGKSNNHVYKTRVYALKVSTDSHKDYSYTEWTKLTNHVATIYSDRWDAPNYCNNPDKALATAQIIIPQDLETGLYSFLWVYYFGSSEQKSNAYVTCWEAFIEKKPLDVINRRIDLARPLVADQKRSVHFTGQWTNGAMGYIFAPKNSFYLYVFFPSPVSDTTWWGCDVCYASAHTGKYILDQGQCFLKKGHGHKSCCQTHKPNRCYFAVTYSTGHNEKPCTITRQSIGTDEKDIIE